MIEHGFTSTIREILSRQLGDAAEAIFAVSDLLKYINLKTKSADRGSKSRASFGNLYAIYVLVEDYVRGGFDEAVGTYADYAGAKFSDLFKRQRELPFGSKLQNHALNHRLNKEYEKYFPASDEVPITIPAAIWSAVPGARASSSAAVASHQGITRDGAVQEVLVSRLQVT